jgi:nucleotide-binding universal stress UspA family protein
VIEDMGGERYEKFCPMILSKVLIPTDMSPKSLETVNSISRVPGIGELILIHIIPWGEDPDSIESRMTQAFIVMKQICVDLSHKGISARGDVLIGDPVQTVIRYGEEENVSLISVVPYEKSWLSEVIFGSFTCDLAEQTTRPVLIVKER